MGNKQSAIVDQQAASRSLYSWQPDALYEPEVKRRDSSVGGGGGGPPTIVYAGSEFGGSPGVYRNRRTSGESRNGNAAFGGMEKFKSTAGRPGSPSKSRPTDGSFGGGGGGSMGNKNDDAEQRRLRGSRLSLNDAMLELNRQCLHHSMMPGGAGPPGPFPAYVHHIPPGMLPFGVGMPPPPPPDPYLMNVMHGARMPPVDEKKVKKLRKKQQKQQQQLSRHGSMLGDMTPDYVQPGLRLMPPPPPMLAFAPMARTQSVDNFLAAGLIPTAAMMGQQPQHMPHVVPPVRRYNSHVDLSNLGPPPPPMPLAIMVDGSLQQQHQMHQQQLQKSAMMSGPKKERKYEKRKDQQPASLRESLGSNRGRLMLAGSAASPRKLDSDVDDVQQKQSQKRTATEKDAIYETLKSKQLVALTVQEDPSGGNGFDQQSSKLGRQDQQQKGDKSSSSSPPPPPPAPTPKSVLITPEAKVIQERNARLLLEAEQQEKQLERAPRDPDIKAQELAAPTPDALDLIQKAPPTPPTPPPPPPAPPPVPPSTMPQQQPQLQQKQQQQQQQIAHQQHHYHQQQHQQQQPRTETKPNEHQPTPPEVTPTTTDEDDIESMIEAVLNPVLPRKKQRQSTSGTGQFEPLDAWRGLDVRRELQRRQPTKPSDNAPPVEERIQVRLVSAAPSRRENGEPIYLEYDERLPEFKKRLIETGSFDIPEVEKFQSSGGAKPPEMDATARQIANNNSGQGQHHHHHHHQQQQQQRPMNNRQSDGLQQPHDPPRLWRDYVALEQSGVVGPGNNDNNTLGSVRSRKTADSKGSLKRLKESMASMFRTKSTDQLRPSQTGGGVDDVNLYNGGGGGGGGGGTAGSRYAPSLTPSTSKIKAGDSSDIDFSWIHDLETRFRMERDQFERELRVLKQKSAATAAAGGQPPDYMLSPGSRDDHPPMVSSGDLLSRSSPSLPRAQLMTSAGNRRPEPNDGGWTSAGGQVDPGRMAVYRSQPNVTSIDPSSNTRYFGVYDSPASLQRRPSYNRSDAELERTARLQADAQQSPGEPSVRAKAAMFDIESQRVQREMQTRNQQLARQKQQQHQALQLQLQLQQQQQQRPAFRHQHSEPSRRPAFTDDEPIYIPRPDYDDAVDSHGVGLRARHQPQTTATGGGGGGVGNTAGRYANHEPLSVSTVGNQYQQQQQQHAEPRSPSERRLNRFYSAHTNWSTAAANAAAAAAANSNANANANVGGATGRLTPDGNSAGMQIRSGHAQQQQPQPQPPPPLSSSQRYDQDFKRNPNVEFANGYAYQSTPDASSPVLIGGAYQSNQSIKPYRANNMVRQSQQVNGRGVAFAD